MIALYLNNCFFKCITGFTNVNQLPSFLISILYRDLKPDNLGMDKEGSIKIFDFGMATELFFKSCDRFGPDEYNATAYTGTLRYMSPENLFGKPYGLPSDIYSFALVLYEVVR